MEATPLVRSRSRMVKGGLQELGAVPPRGSHLLAPVIPAWARLLGEGECEDGGPQAAELNSWM